MKTENLDNENYISYQENEENNNEESLERIEEKENKYKAKIKQLESESK